MVNTSSAQGGTALHPKLQDPSIQLQKDANGGAAFGTASASGSLEKIRRVDGSARLDMQAGRPWASTQRRAADRPCHGIEDEPWEAPGQDRRSALKLFPPTEAPCVFQR